MRPFQSGMQVLPLQTMALQFNNSRIAADKDLFRRCNASPFRPCKNSSNSLSPHSTPNSPCLATQGQRTQLQSTSFRSYPCLTHLTVEHRCSPWHHIQISKAEVTLNGPSLSQDILFQLRMVRRRLHQNILQTCRISRHPYPCFEILTRQILFQSCMCMGKVAVTPLREIGGWWLWVARRQLFLSRNIHSSTAEPFSPPLFPASKFSQDECYFVHGQSCCGYPRKISRRWFWAAIDSK